MIKFGQHDIKSLLVLFLVLLFFIFWYLVYLVMYILVLQHFVSHVDWIGIGVTPRNYAGLIAYPIWTHRSL